MSRDIFRDHNEEIPDEVLNNFEESHAFNVTFDNLIKEILLILIPGLRAIIIKFQKLENRSYTDADGNIIVNRLQADKVILCDYRDGRLEIG